MTSMDTCSNNMSWPDCQECYEDFNGVYLQHKLDEPKPWIGMYIAAASAICGIAMAVDLFNGFKTKKLWIPCKYFSLNATSLTLLAVAMKLAMDLTSTKLSSGSDVCAGFSTVVLMSSAMGNFMTSLASMNDNEIMLNLAALGILVTTVVINVWVFNVQLNSANGEFELYFDDFVSVFILLLLVLLCTYAIIAPTTKRCVETKFWEMHNMILNEREHGAKFTAQELKVLLKKYWVMAGTGNPQFVMARTVICVIPSVVCLSMTLSLFVMIGIIIDENSDFLGSESIYKWSVDWILIIQTVAAVIGTVAPTSRLFVAARLRSTRTGCKSLKVELKTETYWTQRLIDWRGSPVPLPISRFKIKKIIHVSKKVLLNMCIIIQIMIVLTSKLILIICSWFINVIFNFMHNVNKLRRHVFKCTSDRRGNESRDAGTNELNYSPYVMLLEGEIELPNGIITNISNEADKLIQVGKKRKPEKIIELLQKSVNFNGVRDFERKNVASIHVQEPRNSWSLSVVTLTKIAIALPNISSLTGQDFKEVLFSSVNEALKFVKFIVEKTDTRGELVRIRKTTDIIWEQLELDWMRREKGVVKENNTYKETLLDLSTNAQKVVVDFKNSKTDSVMNNPLNWPTDVIAANSMYRVCESLMLIEINGIEDQLDQKFFERLTVIISDILAACLTNLAHIIFTECHMIPVEKRQESIRHTLILLGESEEIIQCLEHRELPNLDHDKARYIEEWRTILELGKEIPANSVSTTDDSSTPQSLNRQVVINVDSSC